MNVKKMIIPAIIAKNQEELNNSLSKVKDHVELIQLDVMDNIFVPNTSLFFDFDLPDTKCNYEAHLMVDRPDEWIEKNADKVSTILVHFESSMNPEKIIETAREKNKKIGFVLNPETSVEKIKPYIDSINQILIMTVKPGFYGSKFIPEMKEKIREIRELKPSIDIEVDGGITDKTIEIVDRAGANMFVSGSYIVKSDDVKKAVETLEKIVNQK